MLWRPLDVIGDYERIAITIFAAAGIVIVILALFAGSAIAGRGLEPLATMAAVASEIEAHDLTRRLSNGAWDVELRAFADTFDRMLERLESAFRRQRQFTADASHDLRAPLAVIRAEADLSLARTRKDAADTESFRSIRDEVLELDRLIESLLSAARADDGPINATAIDLADVAARVAERLRTFAQSRSVELAIDVAPPALVLGDADIVERVLISILHNGIKFSPRKGTVFVRASEPTATTISFDRARRRAGLQRRRTASRVRSLLEGRRRTRTRRYRSRPRDREESRWSAWVVASGYATPARVAPKSKPSFRPSRTRAPSPVTRESSRRGTIVAL